jgi:hypothetical protein
LTFADVTTPGSCPNAFSITRTWTCNRCMRQCHQLLPRPLMLLIQHNR